MLDDLVVIAFAQLDLLQDGQHVAQGLFPGVGILQIFLAVQLLQVSFLKFDCVNAGIDGHVDQLDGQVQETVVVDADLGDDVGRLAIADQAVADLDQGHELPPVNFYGSLGISVAGTRIWGVRAAKPPAHPQIWSLFAANPEDPFFYTQDTSTRRDILTAPRIFAGYDCNYRSLACQPH